ncbi:amino acid permease superfamily protein [Acanthamoeba castellanii str. Neff]|uniref:Amino acid permease superfamily protein n=1 Tax=Acanthamoeba castellanii (strain ATCC 30010 / Neff) TaxID=1257118 RepID=L8HDJ9_ACACF|nr:amino acid permease superfamily protein [Acanthamoeba castellanii str. Neff]ELR23265.1 amino acid permease superfamily protein [Acanthamoeba castellanii str. Neff]
MEAQEKGKEGGGGEMLRSTEKDPHGDTSMLQSFGYDQELSRSLGPLTSFGLAFSYTSPTVGAYTLFAFGLATGGGLFIWGLPIVVAGQVLVALIFAELAVIYPMAGALYQWARRLIGPRYGWLVGWAYCWALLITIAAVDLGAAPFVLETLGLRPFGSAGGEGVEESSVGEVGIALLVCALQTTINIGGVRITTLLTNVGMILEFIMTLGIALFLLVSSGPHQPYSSVFEPSPSYTGNLPFLSAILSQAFIFYGFESAAAVSEEVRDSRKSVPRTMVLSLISAAFAVLLLQSRPDLSTTSISAIFQICYVSCAGAEQAAIARMIWAYARDDVLPFSSWLKKVSPRTQVPVNATLVAAAIPMCVMLTTLIRVGKLNVHEIVVDYCIAGGRLDKHTLLTEQTTHHSDYFGLGKLRLPVGIGALVYGVAMIVNLLWPRPVDELRGWVTLLVTVAVLAVGVVVVRGRNKQVTSLSASFHFDERTYLLEEAKRSPEALNMRATLHRPLSFSSGAPRQEKVS